MFVQFRTLEGVALGIGQPRIRQRLVEQERLELIVVLQIAFVVAALGAVQGGCAM